MLNCAHLNMVYESLIAFYDAFTVETFIMQPFGKFRQIVQLPFCNKLIQLITVKPTYKQP